MNNLFNRIFRKDVSEKGFTLVELMVVVAIIGVLSAVAIPNFRKYQAKSKTSEAKLQLAAIYSSEQSFYIDYDTYSTCLDFMGYDPSQEIANRYYAVGFAADNEATVTAAVNNGAAGCAGADTFFYPAGKTTGTATMATEVGNLPGGSAVTTAIAFQAGAGGAVSSEPAAGFDQWSIDQNKNIAHEAQGY